MNLIDTPGLVDFFGHTVMSMPSGDTVAVVVNASKGIEPVTRRVMKIAAERKLPRMIIVEHLDDTSADLDAVTARIRTAFGKTCLPVSLPTASRDAVVSVLKPGDSPADPAFGTIGEAKKAIIEQVVETDEELMMEYLDNGADGLDPHAVHNAFEQAMRDGHLVPICFTCAKSGAGIDELVQFIEEQCPSPGEGNPRPFFTPDGEEVDPEPDASKPVIAHVFKVTADPFVGKLCVFRVHQGTIKAKSEIYVDGQKKPIRIGHIVKLEGKEHVEVDEVGPGGIAAVAKIEEIHLNSVLTDKAEPSLKLAPLPLPKPMYGLAVELKNHGDDAKFGGAISKLAEEDPCFKLERIAATKQTVMRGMGELHLRVMLERLKDEANIEIATSPPKVAYKETIMGTAEGHHRHKKQTGGAGQFGEVYLRVAPLPSDHDEGFEFVNATVGGSVPRQFMPAIEKGIRSVLQDGAIAGYPLNGVRVEVYDGKHHPVDSKEIAFITAGKRAFIEAVSNAHPALLEPFVDLEIIVPNDHMGDIAGDIAGKRGRVQNTDMLGDGMVMITATAPLGEIQNFTNELKSMTGGQGSFTMDYSHDEQAPPHVQQEVIAAFSPQHEE